jgi:DNA modification methylase
VNHWRILHGDVRNRLAELEAGSVRCCVTSPPYYGLRDYGMSSQLGLERTPEAYVAAMVGVFTDVRRVLADDGTLWLNIGDSYAASGRGGNPEDSAHQKQGSNRGTRQFYQEHLVDAGALGRKWVKPPKGYKAKDLIGIPWMLAFALRADGWFLRQDIVWHKPNPMPESVVDRCTKAHEYLFLLSKRGRYYFDASAMQEPGVYPAGTMAAKGSVTRTKTPFVNGRPPEYKEYNGMRNKRSVWTVTTKPYPDAHFATYPEELIEPCILAGSAYDDTILDPFTGSGTTGAVAIGHRRNFVGVELNPAYVELARKRINAVAPMFAEEVA